MIELVIFDFDGTLVDSMWVWKEVDKIFLKRRNIKVPSDLQKKISGLSFSETAEYFKNEFKLNDSIEEIKNEWIDLSNELYQKKVKLKSNVLEILEYIKNRNIKLCIASSNHEKIIENFLHRKKLNKKIKDVFTGCQFRKGKNSDYFYRKIADYYSIDCKNILFIDDIYESIDSAKKAGVNTVGVYDKHTVSDRLRKRSDFFISNLIKIKDIIEAL